ncbi:ClbS/DfsB family four-helix bundle protein [Candidatus Gracilibacteria bacterium]|nr:ClbS/DfsB family four-helix bundle protein [Candidatus Gracilibacteria bacterium]
MNAHAFRHFYAYHFAENRTLWQNYIAQLSDEQFTQPVAYSHGSVRDQILHLMSVDDVWFSELQGVAPAEPLPSADVDNRTLIRTYWDAIEQRMHVYLASLRDDMLFTTPIAEPAEDKDLMVWQVLLHVVNHGTDHRAQLLRVLNDLGVKTTSQDYIFYAYEHAVLTPHGEWSTKSELLQWLDNEYRQWEVLLAQVSPARMDQPGVNGDWSMKDIVAHLTGWQRRVVANLQAAQRGEPEPPPPWPAHLTTDDDINAWIYETNRARSVPDILADMQHVFQQLLAIIADFPDTVRVEHIKPAFYLVWVGGERYLTGEFFNHFHDDHEQDIRAWLARIETQ